MNGSKNDIVYESKDDKQQNGHHDNDDDSYTDDAMPRD